jgi:hypothetical protein
LGDDDARANHNPRDRATCYGNSQRVFSLFRTLIGAAAFLLPEHGLLRLSGYPDLILGRCTSAHSGIEGLLEGGDRG